MKKKTKGGKTIAARAPREDGEATRARIIDAAGRLFAGKGFAETTNREISKAAKSNVTGINYHFGNREGLHEVVVREVGDYILSPEHLACFEDCTLTDRRKIEIIIEHRTRLVQDNWRLRLWVREVVAPSSVWLKMADERITSRFDVMQRVLSGYTGIPVGEPELDLCLVNVASQVMSLLMVSQTLQKKLVSLPDADPAAITESLKNFLFAGIDRLARDYAAKGDHKRK